MSTWTTPSAEVLDCAIAVTVVSRKQAIQIFSIIGALSLIFRCEQNVETILPVILMQDERTVACAAAIGERFRFPDDRHDEWKFVLRGSSEMFEEGKCWLPLRDSNPNMLLQRQLSYR